MCEAKIQYDSKVYNVPKNGFTCLDRRGKSTTKVISYHFLDSVLEVEKTRDRKRDATPSRAATPLHKNSRTRAPISINEYVRMNPVSRAT